MLEVKELQYDVGKKTVLADITFHLSPGQVLAVVGPSGSGKTTLLRLLMGFECPAGGIISWKGNIYLQTHEVTVLPEKRYFSMVFQDAVLFPHLTVEGNVRFGLKKRNTGEQNDILEQWLTKLDLKTLRKRRVESLSGGERQRVALAQALAVNPEMILLDEPFSSVDRLVRHDLIQLIKTVLLELNAATILVTHDMRDAIDMADDLVLLNQGKLIQKGPIGHVLHTPEDSWASHFIACCLGMPAEKRD